MYKFFNKTHYNMKKIYFIVTYILIVLVASSNIQAQNFTSILTSTRPWGKGDIVISLTPDHTDWLYDLGENAVINVGLTNTATQNATINYEIKQELMDPVLQQGTVQITNGAAATLQVNAMTEPGFLRCKFWANIDGVNQEEIVTLGFAPFSILPTITKPESDDFMDFWTNTISNARAVSPNYILTHLPDKSDANTDVYQLELDNYQEGKKFYSVVNVPKAPGEYPALIQFPGAGVYPSFWGKGTSASKNIIVIDVYIHEYPVTMESAYYANLDTTVLAGYAFLKKEDTRDTYYYKKVITGCIKTIDWLFQYSKFDGKTLIASGSSQGGALSIMVTALDKRIKSFTALYPALSDQTGFLYGRAGGWPQYFRWFKPEYVSSYNVNAGEITKYYDTVNFAQYITVPGYFSWGYNDEVTPPTSVYACYNQINTPKETLIILNGEHASYPEVYNSNNAWQDQELTRLKNETGTQNPTSQDIKHYINIEGNNIYLQFEDSNTDLTIYNISGQQAYSQSINSQSIAIQLPKGIYFLTVNNKSIKFII